MNKNIGYIEACIETAYAEGCGVEAARAKAEMAFISPFTALLTSCVSIAIFLDILIFSHHSLNPFQGTL
jgi:hypothetical protein